MSEIRISNLEPWVVEALHMEAEREGTLLEIWLKGLLLRQLRDIRNNRSNAKDQMLRDMRALVEDARQTYGTLDHSTRFIREERDQHG